MTKYAKPRKPKTLRKGWKPSEYPLPEGIESSDLDRMAQRIEKILANSHTPNETELVLLEQARLLCLRVKAYQNRESILNELNDRLSNQKDILHHCGFKENRHIIPLNLWITRKVVFQKGGVEELLKKVESKMAVLLK